MKSFSIFLTVSLLVFATGCKSEVDTKPAAEVSETTATTATTDTAPAGVRANVIKEKSKVEFVGAKVTRDHKGGFRNFDGWIEYAGTTPSRLEFTIDLNSIFTDTEKLTGHLKTADFFDVAKYPTATFTSTSIAPAAEGSATSTAGPAPTHTVTGILDLHGVKKEVSFPVTAEVTAEGVRTRSEFTINRHDWGISYRGATDDLIKDNVLMKLDLFFPPPPAA
jgi:polyisoprenoid-binding protein YceI